jgi:hypothetical protein
LLLLEGYSVLTGAVCRNRESMKKRLLHNGANTMQIIDVYISTIKVRPI